MPNLFCFFGCNKNSKLSVFSCPKNDVLKAQWETNLGIKLKNNFVICENHFDSNDIERQVIKKDHNGKIIFSVSRYQIYKMSFLFSYC